MKKQTFLSRARDRIITGLGGFTSRTVTPADIDAAIQLGVSNGAGVSVNEDSIERLWVVYRCVDFLAKMLGAMPMHTYRYLEAGGKERALTHPVYELLRRRPNRVQTPFVFKYMIMHHMLITGNFYAEIQWKNGYPIALWPLNPRQTKVVYENKMVRYKTRVVDKEYTLMPEQVLHIKNGTIDGLKGRSAIQVGTETYAVGIATKMFGSKFFKNGAAPVGALSTNMKLDPEVQERIKTQWQDLYGGLENSHRTAVLEQGLTWQTIGISPEDAQLIEVQKKTDAEIAAMFGVPLHKINILDNATFSNIEHQGIEFITDTMLPHAVNIEEELGLKLFVGSEGNMFVEIMLDALARGDMKTRMEAYGIGIQNGFMSPDEVRGKENLNPLPDDKGQIIFRPMNLTAVPLTDNADKSIENVEPKVDNQLKTASYTVFDTIEERRVNERRELSDGHEEAMRRTSLRILKREVRELRKMLKPDMEQAEVFRVLEDFYKDIRDAVRELYDTPVRQFLESVRVLVKSQYGQVEGRDGEYNEFVDGYIDGLTARHLGRSRGQLEGITRNSDPEHYLDEIENRFTDWVDKRPGKIAAEEKVRQLNAGTKTGLILAGYLTFRWVANSGACPMCTQLDGKIVSIYRQFVEAGEKVGTDDVNMKAEHSVGHGPLHGGCQCTIAPGSV
jgi:HK97 family phage portal protein